MGDDAGTAGAVPVVTGGGASAVSAPAFTAPRVDLHAHFIPDVYRDALIAAGLERADGMPGIPAWSVGAALEMMDRFAISAQCVSISSPGVQLGDGSDPVALARLVNEAGAELVDAHPSRFGFLASLPLPDVGASLAELDHALDQLDADGVVLMTHTGEVYVGDPRLEPIWEALSARGVTVVLHPCAPTTPAGPVTRPAPIMEFLFDTTRAVSDLILAGTLERNPGVRLVVPHGGAALPALGHRIAAIGQRLLSHEPGSDKFLDTLRSCWFDLAGFPVPAQLSGLLTLADRDRLVWGSDWPYTPEPMIAPAAEALDLTDLLTPAEIAGVRVENARRLVPRLSERAASPAR